MRRIVLCLLACVVGVAGCVSEEPLPQIVYQPEQKPIVPKPAPPKKAWPGPLPGQAPGGWIPSPQIEKRWSAIVIHHSATSTGGAAVFDRWHREQNNWDGVGYDFVIGNGTDSGDGEVEVTFRWTEQRVGAHCKTPGNWANTEAVGICLVGDFDSGVPTRRQIYSLVKLIRFLEERYNVPKSRVYGHNTTPGARATDCPGANFPMAEVKLRIR